MKPGDPFTIHDKCRCDPEEWETRKHYRYYALLREWVEASGCDSILDVGAGATPLASWGAFGERAVVDTQIPLRELREPLVDYHCCDFRKPVFVPRAGLVVCAQVLHLLRDKDVVPFVWKLFERAGHSVILTIPWMREGDVQEPMDWGTLKALTGRRPSLGAVVGELDGSKRACALYHL